MAVGAPYNEAIQYNDIIIIFLMHTVLNNGVV